MGEDKEIMPVVKLMEFSNTPPGAKGPYKVIGLSQTIKYSIGQWLTKEDVVELLDTGAYKVSVK